MAAHKVHVIEPEFSDNLAETLAKRDALGKAIGALAKSINAPIFFHDYTGAVGGAPVILLECSDSVLELFKRLPGFGRSYENSPHIATQRSAKLWSYFTGSPAITSRRRGTPQP